MIRRAFVLPMGAPIAPFGDAPADARVLNRRLEDLQREALASAGVTSLERVRAADALPDAKGDPYLVLSDDLFFTRTLLADFVVQAQAGDPAVPARLALPDGKLLRDSEPLQDLERGEQGGRPFAAFPMWLVRGAAPGPALAGARPVVVDPREEVRAIEDVPRVFAENGRLEFALTSRVAMRIEHWVHLLRANQTAMLASLAELKDRPKIVNAVALAWLLLRAFPPTEARVMRAAVRRGRKVKIHPSAVVEASVLGDGVQIGAHALVRGSVLAAGATVAEGAAVEMSVLGEKARVTKNCLCNFNVLYPGAVLGYGIHQMSILGRDAFVSAQSILLDFKFEGEIHVEHRGRIVSSGARFLGAAIGHGARVGAGVVIGQGRAVPSRASMVMDAARVAQKFSPAAVEGATLTVRDGVVVPLESRESRESDAAAKKESR